MATQSGFIITDTAIVQIPQTKRWVWTATINDHTLQCGNIDFATRGLAACDLTSRLNREMLNWKEPTQ